MKLTKFEQSGFMLETDSGYKLAIDIGAMTPLEKLGGITVDAMIVSHLHQDHFSESHIQKLAPKKLFLSSECISLLKEKLALEIVQVKAGDSIDAGGGIRISIFEVDHGPNVSLRPKENFGFLVEADGKKTYFGGDIFYPSGLDPTGLEVDYALIPVGGFYTFDPAAALDYAKRFKKIGKVIPMHYHKTPQTKEEFVKLAMENGLHSESPAL